jgi:hypothetical protein
VDVPHAGRTDVQRQQGRPRPDDHGAGPPHRHPPRHLRAVPRDPDWFQNLRQVTTAQVQVRERRFAARPRELYGAERDVMWRDTILAEAPEVSRFERKAGRTIPVAVLEPV